MSRVIRLQLLLSFIGAAIVAALVGTRAYGSGPDTLPDVGGAYVEGITGQPKFLNPLLAAFIHVSSELAFILNSARLLPGARGEEAVRG